MVEPADLRLAGEDEVLQDEQPRESVLTVGAALGRPLRPAEGLALEPGQVVEVAQRGGALGLDDPLHVDVRRGDGQGQLDGQPSREVLVRSTGVLHQVPTRRAPRR